MNKKTLYIVIGIAVAIALVFLFLPTGTKKKISSATKKDNSEPVVSTSSEYSSFPEAPAPSAEEAALENEAEKLWPHLAKKVDVEKKREEVKKEWNEFTAKFPKNFYIPQELKVPQTESEKLDARKELDIVSKLDSKLAVDMINSSKSAVSGTNPTIPTKPEVTPEEQRTFISFKQKELQSRIELIEYSIEAKAINGDQLPIARKDILAWKKQLTELDTVQSQIPRT